jgi:hypothetical protein
VFPLVLGALDSSALSRQRELKDVEREHERVKRELDARVNAAKSFEAEIQRYYLQSRSLGLLPDSPVPIEGWSLEKYLLELKKVPENVKTMDLPDVQEGTGESSAVELRAIINEEDKLGQEVGSMRRRFEKLDQLSASIGDYGRTLTGQEDRMQGVGWFEEKVKDTHKCPVCDAIHSERNHQLAELQTLARELKDLTASVHQAPPKLEQELATLREELRAREGALSKARQKRKSLESRSAEQAAYRQRVRQIYLFVGRVEQALENVSASQNLEDLRDKVKRLSERISLLKRDLDPRAQQQRLKASVATVSSKIAAHAERLQLEHASENVQLNIRELTLEFHPLSGRTDFLWELGSGQNWVGYHVAGLLGLHEHFVSLMNNVVPRFLIIDQPSQVYFPEAWPTLSDPSNRTDKNNVSADIEGVRRIFSALSHFMETMKNQFQIIVTEHAGAITWEGIPQVHLVGNWRKGHDEFLIPDHWIQGRSSETKG